MNYMQKEYIHNAAKRMWDIGRTLEKIYENPGKLSTRDTIDIGIIGSQLKDYSEKLERFIKHYE